MPRPYRVRTLCELVAAERGRPIRLLELPGDDEILGAWLATDETDLIFYKPDTTPPHQDHIILHELGHVICEHYPAANVKDQRHLLFPSLSPAVVRRVLKRTTYWSEEEQEAELLASLIWRRACRESRPRTAAVRRMDAVLTGTVNLPGGRGSGHGCE
ncbi:ImmA/IrrE family metallo-endopeptidase [Nonomuraea guangzhouensis]|uniref:ImmA/IrrE family metallo-endopeptidase n=1 Tax=Nonomuraea guangzhouensis TaxID=1291555 RepID=A0ABW4GJ63_9ACTN|nr:ImmA/IrrE family metallo-endopeptidase [Nonomuraea guangzhouensis]